MNPAMSIDVFKAPLAEATKTVFSKVQPEAITPEVLQTTVKYVARTAIATVGFIVVGDTANKAIEAQTEVAVMRHGYDRTVDANGKKLTRER